MKNLAISASFVFFPWLLLAQSPERIQIGVCIGLDKLQAAQDAGFDYAEVSVSKVASLSEDEFRHLLRQAAQLRIPLSAANTFIPGDIKLVGPSIDEAQQMNYVSRALARMKKLGVSVVVLGSGGARRVPEGFSRAEAVTQLKDFCRRLAPVAHENGITIAIEPLRHQETNIINTTKEGLSLVEAVNLPEIRLLVDYYHLAEEEESPDVLQEAAPWLVHTHIANPRGRVYPLSLDESDYAVFFDMLCRIGYCRRISIEASTPDFASQAPRSIALLRRGLNCRKDH
jgi:D-psicose/D-tagatose/L-ribulose 3-epimerase